MGILLAPDWRHWNDRKCNGLISKIWTGVILRTRNLNVAFVQSAIFERELSSSTRMKFLVLRTKETRVPYVEFRYSYYTISVLVEWKF